MHSEIAMLALSAFTNQSDPYRAGLALGEALAKIRPEVVFLFCSINYGSSADLAHIFHQPPSPPAQ